MKTIEISVNDQDFSKLRSILAQLDFVKNIIEKKEHPIEGVSLASEPSLAEEWNSTEDARYEKYFHT